MTLFVGVATIAESYCSCTGLRELSYPIACCLCSSLFRFVAGGQDSGRGYCKVLELMIRLGHAACDPGHSVSPQRKAGIDPETGSTPPQIFTARPHRMISTSPREAAARQFSFRKAAEGNAYQSTFPQERSALQEILKCLDKPLIEPGPHTPQHHVYHRKS